MLVRFYVISGQHIQRGKIQPSAAKISADSHSGYDFKALLEIKGGQVYMSGYIPVSYTHLAVYKRQEVLIIPPIMQKWNRI